MALNNFMPCKYRCQKCRYEFERGNPGSVVCEKCKHTYVDWLNFKEVLWGEEAQVRERLKSAREKFL